MRTRPNPFVLDCSIHVVTTGTILQRKMAFYLPVGWPSYPIQWITSGLLGLVFPSFWRRGTDLFPRDGNQAHTCTCTRSFLSILWFCSDNNFDCVTSPLVPVVAHGRLNIAAFILISNLNFERDIIVFFLLEVGRGGGGYLRGMCTYKNLFG